PSFTFVSPGDSDGDGLTDAFELAHGLDPYNAFSKASGVPDEVARDASGKTYFEIQSASSPAATGSHGGGGGGCGLTGLEAILFVSIAGSMRRRRRILYAFRRQNNS